MEPQSQPVTSDMMQPQIGQIITSNPMQFPAPISLIYVGVVIILHMIGKYRKDTTVTG